MTTVLPMTNQPKGGSGQGLQYLAQIDQFLVHQTVELFEVLTGIETQNRYSVKNSMGQQIYWVQESTEVCMLICCGNGRSFTFFIYDNNGQVVARIFRKWRCCWGCCWCATKDSHCAWEVQVEAPPGNIVGYIRQGKSFCNPVYYVCDANKQDIFACTRHCCMCQWCCCTADLDFDIYPLNEDGSYDASKERVGWMAKQWAGCCKENFTKANNFSTHFPADLDVNLKLTMLALTLQIDFHFFEESNDNNH